MNRKFSILLIGLFLFSLYSASEVNSQDLEKISFEGEQNYEIILLNYDPDYINLEYVRDGLPTLFPGLVNQHLNYNIQHADAQMSSDLNDFIDSVSSPSWTSKLNEDAIREQVLNFKRKAIFDTQNGTAIDARALDAYLNEYVADRTTIAASPSYLFILNLSRLDDAENDHWLNVTEIDVDSKKQRTYWRLEWDNELNNNVRFPFSAFSETTDLTVIDPTAHQWYLDWRTEWTPIGVYDPFYENDLDHLIEGFTQEFAAQLTSSTVLEWIREWIVNVYNVDIHPVQIGSSVTLDIKIAYSAHEVTQENLDWVINTPLVQDQISRLVFPQSITMNIEYFDLDEDNIYREILYSNRVEYRDIHQKDAPFEDWFYFDGVAIWDAIETNEELTAEFPLESSENQIYVRAIFFILDNASFVGFTPWSGGLYTGLGGDQRLTMLHELDRIFKPDHTTPKAGATRVLVHEAGHAIGVPHPFNTTGGDYASDFGSEVMGYYPGDANYSKILVDVYHRISADQKIAEFITLYNDKLDDNDLTDELSSSVLEFFDEVKVQYSQKNYLTSYLVILDAIEILELEIEDTSLDTNIYTDSEFPTPTYSTFTTETESETPVNLFWIANALLIIPLYVRYISKSKK